MKHFYNTVVIEICFDAEIIEQLSTLKTSPILENAKSINMIYVHKPKDPDNENFVEMEKDFLNKMEELKKLIVPKEKISYCNTECKFTNNVKIDAIEYLDRVKPDIVINATHSLHEIDSTITESFSDFLIKHAPCDVFIIRPKRK